MLYALLSFVLLFVVISVVVIIVKICLKKKTRKTGSVSSNDIDNRNASNEYNESIEIYEEPVWKNDQSDTIKVKPNAGYAKHTF